MDEDGAVSDIPESIDRNWLLLAYQYNPMIRFDGCVFDRVLANDRELVVEVGDHRYGLSTANATVATSIAEGLSPHTRSGAIRSAEAYEHAKKLLARRPTPTLFFGEDAAFVSDEHFYVGEFVCRISDIMQYVDACAPLPLPNGKLHAFLAMILVLERSRSENREELRQKVLEFEAGRAR